MPGAPGSHMAQHKPDELDAGQSDLGILEMMLPSHGKVFADQVWELYSGLPDGEKTELRTKVVRYLRHVCRGEVDARRCWEVLSEFPPSHLRRRLVPEFVWCSAKLGMHTRAVECLKLNLDDDRYGNRHPVDPQWTLSMRTFKEILRVSVETPSWPLFREACQTWRMGMYSQVHPSLDFLEYLRGGDAELKFWQHVKHQRNTTENDGVLVGVVAPAAHDRMPSDGSISNATPTPQAGALAETLESAPESDPAAKKASDDTSTSATGVLLDFARGALLRPCRPDVAFAVLQVMPYPKLYNLYFEKMDSMRTTYHLPRLFDDFKSLPGWEMDPQTPQTIRIMFDVNYPHNPVALLELHRLFCRLYYEGNQHSPIDLEMRSWLSKYAIRAVLSNFAQDPLGFVPYVEELNRYGDSDMEQFAMELIKGELQFEDRDIPWFAQLKNYAERLDYEGAMEVWHPRFIGDKPDRVTLVTLLRVASERGDVAFATGLFDKARLWGLDRTPEVLVPVIRAFGRHRTPEEAAKICTWAIKNRAGTTEVFNAMLEVYADLSRLYEMRGLMKIMARRRVAWNAQTYMHLMKTLTRTKRGFEARRLIEKLPKRVPGLSLDHFETVMAGAIKMGFYGMAYDCARRMRLQGMPMTLGTMSMLVKAAYRWRLREEEHPVPSDMEDELKTGKDLLELYRKTTQADAEAIQRGEKPPSIDHMNIRRVAFTLAEAGDSESLYEFAGLYLDAVQQPPSDRHLPNGILTAFMILHHQRTGDYQRVKQLWRVIWERHRYSSRQRMRGVEGSYRTAPKVHPQLQYSLDDAFHIMQQVLTLERDPDGLLKMIFDITSLGYSLGRRSWNHAIQALAAMGRWKEAFKFNEQMLMPNWTGWRHFRRYKNTRRRQTAWDRYDGVPQEPQVVEGEAGEIPPEPIDDQSLSAKERQYRRDHRLVSAFLQHMYTHRKTRRLQKERKLKGTSINLSPRIRDPGRSPRYLRPNAHTLHQLAKTYYEMDETNSWVGNAQEWLGMFCPVSSLAIWTLRYADDLEMGWDKHRKGWMATSNPPEEWGEAYESVEDTEGAEDEYGDTAESQTAAVGPAGEAEGTLSKPLRGAPWDLRLLPPSMHRAIANVLEQAPGRKAIRRKEKNIIKEERRKKWAALQEEEREKKSWEELEDEQREKERAEWMRKAGIVDIEELEVPLTTENFFGDETGEKDEESEDGESEEEEEVEEFERDHRRRRHKARRGKKNK